MTEIDPKAPTIARTLEFEVSNHDDIFGILGVVQERKPIPAFEAAEFTIGLKFFTEVVIRHRHEELFAELFADLSTFMRKLKSRRHEPRSLPRPSGRVKQ